MSEFVSFDEFVERNGFGKSRASPRNNGKSHAASNWCKCWILDCRRGRSLW
jgi:hypothetical protein